MSSAVLLEQKENIPEGESLPAVSVEAVHPIVFKNDAIIMTMIAR